ncbi:hypothetical protein [Ruminococcus sp.]|uniref:hypothetical protein n=1 Tax=Ruminococcus sp. TaxID=41978 RepID=UPI0025D014CA|nr:hypothetical protein [Ruminococcus sp.]MCR4638258.1 hypothetical protein [Ruminococcus sp.]
MLLRDLLEANGASGTDTVRLSIHDVKHWEGDDYQVDSIPEELLDCKCKMNSTGTTYIVDRTLSPDWDEPLIY